MIAARDGSVFCRNCYDNKFGVFGRASSVGRPIQTTSVSVSSDRLVLFIAHTPQTPKFVKIQKPVYLRILSSASMKLSPTPFIS